MSNFQGKIKFFITYKNKQWQICDISKENAVKLWQTKGGFYDEGNNLIPIDSHIRPDKVEIFYEGDFIEV